MDRPSPRNWAALLEIDKFMQRYEVAPSLRELTRLLGIKAVSGARAHVRRLEEFGMIRFLRTERGAYAAARSIRLTDKGRAGLKKYRPLVEAGLLYGERMLALTGEQLERAKAVDVPVESFKRSVLGEETVLVCKSGKQRDYWAERILEATGEGWRLEG